jgi:hypothetical protein
MLTAELIEWVEFREIHGELVLVTRYKPMGASSDVRWGDGGGLVPITAQPKSQLTNILGMGSTGKVGKGVFD